jgi:hypothetical protein
VRERTHPQHKQQGPRELVLVPGDETLTGRCPRFISVSRGRSTPCRCVSSSCRLTTRAVNASKERLCLLGTARAIWEEHRYAISR